MRLIYADKGYEVLDRLFAAIQKNNYATTQKMLDEAWKEWCAIPTAYDVDKAVERLETLSDRTDDKIMEQEGSEQYWDGFGDGIDEAIKILKSGGIE